MRLLRLSMKAVGPFTDAELDLSAGRDGLHLIYGANEAGKTSTLRALSYLLFGFGHRTSDDFVHDYDQLRVGARLRHSDGEVLDVLRRKGGKNTLRGPDDTTAIPPERLDRFLGGLDQDGFETLFGIDHARLARAGEEIRSGQGRLGELLFAAGTGLAGLRQAQQRLQDRLDALYKPRGEKPRINEALARFRAGQEEIKRLQLSSETWQQHDRAFREAKERARLLGEQVADRNAERNRLERLRNAVPVVARRRDQRSALDALRGVRRLRDDFGKDSRDARETLQLALHAIGQARASLDALAGQLAAVEPPRPLLDAADEIEALKERLGAFEKAREDRQPIESVLAEYVHQARRLLRELGRPEDLDAAESLRLRADEPANIRSLAKQFAAHAARRDEARKAIGRLEAQVERLDRKRSGLGDPRDAEPLRQAARQARNAGDLDDRHEQARVARERAERSASRALARLPGWSRTLDELEQLAAPLDTTIDRFEAEIQAATAAIEALDDKLASEAEEIGQLEARIQALHLEQDVPTEDDLDRARRHRDDGWGRVRSAWLEGTSQGSGRDLADAFERDQSRADALADRLRREADRVTRKSEWLSRLERHRASRRDRIRDREQAAGRLGRLRDDWEARAGPLGVPSATPGELRAWLRHRDEVIKLAEQARDARQALEPLDRSRRDLRRSLERALVTMGETWDRDDKDDGRLAGWLSNAEILLEREDKAARGRDKLRGQAEEADADLARARIELKAAEDDLDDRRIRWAEMMGRIHLEPNASPEQAEAILDRAQELFTVLGERRGLQGRIRDIDRDARQFTEDVGALARRLATDLDARPVEVQARELAGRLRQARAVQEQHVALSRQRDVEAGRLREAEERRDTARMRLEGLCREAGCASPDDLPGCERRSDERRRLEDALRDCEDQLLVSSGGTDADAFAAEVERADADELGRRIEGLALEIDDLQNRREIVIHDGGVEENELRRMTGDDRAAEAAETVQTTLARLQADVGRYAALRLAAAVLRRGIDRYREKNQGPVLGRASRLFADLTGGSFVALEIDDDGDGALLKGVRPDNRKVGVEAMSNGSHDQLYLALRLASLESWLHAHEPIPFVVDDILLNFDDARSLAALRALAALSGRTQVLFFTHHRHLVELAAANLPPDVLFVHELPGTTPACVGPDVPEQAGLSVR